MPEPALPPHQLLTFDLFGETFALPVFEVREVLRLQPVTRLPHAPAWLEGVTNLRGHVLPVVDLRKRFGLPPQPTTPRTRILVAEADTLRFGLIVDAAHRLEPIPAAHIQPPPAALASSTGAAAIRGLSRWNGATVVHLNLQHLFTPEETTALATIH